MTTTTKAKRTYRKYDYWYGIRGVRFIWHGEWADPDLSYKGKVVDMYDIEDCFYEDFKDEHPQMKGESDEEYDVRFGAYLRSRARGVKQAILDWDCED